MRAMETTPAAPLNAVTSSPSLDTRREGQFGSLLVEKMSVSKSCKSCIVPFRELTPTVSES